MDKNTNQDKTFKRAMKFVDHCKPTHPGISNIYVFTLTDHDGKIIDEKYGMNLMTNYGFNQIYSVGTTFTASNTVKLYVGEGTEPISTTSQSMQTACFGGLSATNSDTSKAFNYPIYYAESEQAGNGLITLISRFLICYYPENITNYPNDTRIAEYGIGTSATQLWTHAHVYNDAGQISNIIKRPNTQLTITVYMCLSLYESVIQNNWVNNIFTVITTNAIMYNRMFESGLYTFKRGNAIFKRADTGTHSLDIAVNQNRYTNTTIIPSFTIYDSWLDPSTDNVTTKISRGGYIDGFIFAQDGMKIIETQRLTTVESFEITNFKSNNYLTPKGFSERFGMIPSTSSLTDYSKQKYPQISRLIDARAFLYDWKTHSWVNELSVYSSNNTLYDETPSQTSCAVPIYFYNRNEIITGYLYQNINTSDKILSISGGGLTIYATDKYWTNTQSDPWIFIQDASNVPQEAQQCRYWITLSNSSSLEFTRESGYFQLLEKNGTTPSDNGYASYSFPTVYGNNPTCDNYNYGWYMVSNTVYHPSTGATYTVGTTSTTSFTYGKYLVTFNSVANKIFITDMSQLSSSSFNPEETTLDFVGSVNSLSETYRTESETGIICIQSIKSGISECIVLDLRSSTPRQLHFNWKMSCAIWGTNKIAYIPSGSDNSIYIYNMQTESLDGNPILYPSGVSSVPFIIGHTNYIWFTDANSYAYYVDITSGSRTCTASNYPIGNITNLNNIRMTAVDDVFILYRITDNSYSSSFNNARYIKLSSPAVASNLSTFHTQSNYIEGNIYFKLRYIYSTQYHATLTLLITQGYRNGSSYNAGARNHIIDFGRYLDGDTSTDTYQTTTSNATMAWTLFGENIIYLNNKKIPIFNFMPIKLSGKTDTISSINNAKNVSNKQFNIAYTNTPVWGDGVTNSRGIPPGNPIATTDSSGTIVSWS